MADVIKEARKSLVYYFKSKSINDAMDLVDNYSKLVLTSLAVDLGLCRKENILKRRMNKVLKTVTKKIAAIEKEFFKLGINEGLKLSQEKLDAVKEQIQKGV